MKWYKVFDTQQEAETRIAMNQSVRVVIGQNQICLSHTSQGFFAVQDECAHLQESLSKGKINAWNEVICPWHGYRFDLASGEETSGNGCPALKTFPILIDNKGFFIGI
jgi:nitrite reductase/ring-hydroxylating ferredoxin subunit